MPSGLHVASPSVSGRFGCALGLPCSTIAAVSYEGGLITPAGASSGSAPVGISWSWAWLQNVSLRLPGAGRCLAISLCAASCCCCCCRVAVGVSTLRVLFSPSDIGDRSCESEEGVGAEDLVASVVCGRWSGSTCEVSYHKVRKIYKQCLTRQHTRPNNLSTSSPGMSSKSART
jgi:hypothetical protein